MQRGRNLYLDITQTDTCENKKSERGRSKDLIEARNLLLAHRYYYHAKINRRRYDDVLDNLVKEFFISKSTIIQIVIKEQSVIKEIQVAAPDTNALKLKYDFLNWKNVNNKN